MPRESNVFGVYEKAVTMKDTYRQQSIKLDALAEAMALVAEEFKRSKDPEIAAAGHVLAALIVRQLQSLDRELDTLLEEAGI